MNAHAAIKSAIDSAHQIVVSYLDDLSDDELLHRPAEKGNHINWQLGHLIASEHGMIEQVLPGSMPPLPDGFAERYAREASTSDDAGDFDSKADLLKVLEGQRQGTLAALEKVSEADFDRPSGLDYAPTVGAVFLLQSTHWLMHAGQWAVVRRQLGRPPLF